MAEAAEHKQLDCGIELAILPLPNRHTVSVQFRFLVGFTHEPESKLGISHLLEQTISKGTEQRTGKELSDAFDAMGVGWSSWAGRESVGYNFTCLPEFFDASLELHAEYLRRPTFPEDAVQVATDNLLQEITNLSDDPQDLVTKLFNRQVYGPILGRHVLGEQTTLQSIGTADVVSFFRDYYQAGRLQAAVAGPVDVSHVTDKLNELFSGYGQSAHSGRERFDHTLTAESTHHHKDLEQQHIGICYPGASLDSPLRYAQIVAMGVLSGGMSARLFTELREKKGLVYWVTASTEHPRGIGIVYLGASTKPERCDETYGTLLREIDRLAEDLEESEVRRAVTGIVSRVETRGDITRARCASMLEDLFHFGKLIPIEEKIAKTQAVTMADVKDYLGQYPRNRLNVLTLGPKPLSRRSENL